MTYDITQADILEWSERYEGEPFHAAFMDSPYHLTEVVRRFSSPNAAPAQFGTDGAFQRASKGFMGKDWDGGDVAFRAETRAAIARHIHPGGFIASYGGSRSWHRMAVAMEDAGLLIHPTIFCWVYGSGFPKATRLDVQIDRRAGAARETVGTKKHQPKFDAAGHGYREKDNGYNSKERKTFDVTAPATELAADWAGHRYGGQALKPATEPIIICQKPYEGKPVESIISTGAGALWIDGGRIGADGGGWHGGASEGYGGGYAPAVWKRGNKPGQNGSFNASGGENEGHPGGRWPANFALSHHPDCNGRCVSSCPVRRLGEQSGETTGNGPSIKKKRSDSDFWEQGGGGYRTSGDTMNIGDSGTAARFFHQAGFVAERLEAADPVGYYAKASRTEREAGLDDMQARIMRDLYGTDDSFDEDTIDDGRPTPIDNPYQRGKTERKNIHPTIKPIALNRWLATLLLPPERYGPRRLLIPFAGAGSEMIGAMLAGWEDVQGVELEETHVQIARARIAFWKQMRYKLMNPDAPVKIAGAPPIPDGQTTLW